MCRVQRKSNPIGVLDFETDPFLAGRVPKPFAACVFFSEQDFFVLWESDSRTNFIDRVINALRKLPPCTLYAHNGGRFDFHFLLEYAELGTIQIRSGRVTQMRIGNVTLKDSFPLMPFALEEFQKDKIDYAIFEAHRRNSVHNRECITLYLVNDCRYLLTLVTGFRAIVGAKDTIGAAAFLQMRGMGIQIQSLNETHDDMFRPYYFGGRVQAFEKGIHEGAFQYIDINSAYSFAMLQEHAHGAEYKCSNKLPPLRDIGKCFLHFIGTSNGALPLRSKDGSLEFPNRRGEFFATGWEVQAGIETKTLTVDRVIDCWIPSSTITFKQYVTHFYEMRKHAKVTGDLVRALAYKYLLNSGYGKFAQNPRDFREYRIAPYGEVVRGFKWESDFGSLSLWSRSAYSGFGFFDVATGASITGCVRAMFWRAVCSSRRVLYGDTDAIICAESQMPMGDNLGQWKLEGIVKQARIAGKKLYGVEWAKPKDGERYKIASKGARLSWSDLLQLCKGKSIIWENAAPTFGLNGANFIRREIRAT